MYKDFSFKEVSRVCRNGKVVGGTGDKFTFYPARSVVGIKLALDFPKNLPVDEFHTPIIPGMVEVMRDPLVYGSLGLFDSRCQVGYFTGKMLEDKGDADLRIDLTPPSLAEQVLLFVDYPIDQPPKVSGLDTEFAKNFGAVYYHHNEKSVTTNRGERGTDLWVVDRRRMGDTCAFLQGILDERICQGDLAMAKFREELPKWREAFEKDIIPELDIIESISYTETEESVIIIAADREDRFFYCEEEYQTLKRFITSVKDGVKSLSALLSCIDFMMHDKL